MARKYPVAFIPKGIPSGQQDVFKHAYLERIAEGRSSPATVRAYRERNALDRRNWGPFKVYPVPIGYPTPVPDLKVVAELFLSEAEADRLLDFIEKSLGYPVRGGMYP